MKNHLVSINDLPPEGKKFELDDQDVWLEPLREFKMDCRVIQPLKCEIFAMPAEDGLLIRGDIKGEIAVPCDRCAEDAHVKVDSHFDEFEEVPADEPRVKGAPAKKRAGENRHGNDAEGYIVFERGAPMLNLAEVAWEQFMLAQPARPLCREDCKGVCPVCGVNLNLDSCSCQKNDLDPRMAPLAGLKVKRA